MKNNRTLSAKIVLYLWFAILILLVCVCAYNKSIVTKLNNPTNFDSIVRTVVNSHVIFLAFATVYDVFKYFMGARVETSIQKNILIILFAILAVSFSLFSVSVILKMPNINTLANNSFWANMYYFRFIFVAIISSLITHTIREVSVR